MKEELTQEQKGKLKAEMLNCPSCNPNASYSANPAFFDKWKIKHYFHPKIVLT